MAHSITQADIDEVNNRKSRCRAQFNKDEFVITLTSFYNLLSRMGFWPEACLEPPPDSPPEINTTLARSLGYTDACIALMQQIPYPDDRVVHNATRRILEDTRILDLRREEDLKLGRHPEGDDADDSPVVDGWMLPLMAPSGMEGSVLMLDVELGAIYQYKFVYGPDEQSLEYRVQHHLDGNQEIYAPGYLEPFAYRYSPFTPAVKYFRELHDKYYSLQLLPFLSPRYENDVASNIEGAMGDAWKISFVRRKQAALVGLYREMGWPSDQFDRASFLSRWTNVKQEFRSEELRKMAEDEDIV